MNCYDVIWSAVKGVDVLAIPGMDFVAVPATGRRNAARYQVVDVVKGEFVCELRKSEVTQWLCAAASAREIPFNCHDARLDARLQPTDDTHHGIVPQIAPFAA